MNAPIRDPFERPINDLVDEHLAKERAMHNSMSSSNNRLALFLSTLGARKRREAVAKVWPFKARKGQTSTPGIHEPSETVFAEDTFGEEPGFDADDRLWTKPAPSRQQYNRRQPGLARRVAVRAMTVGGLAAVLVGGVLAANAMAPAATNHVGTVPKVGVLL